VSAAAWHEQDSAGPEATAELRGETLVWQLVLHHARANLANLANLANRATGPHDQLRRTSLDAAADLIHVAEKLLTALDSVLDSKANDHSHSLSVQALTIRLDSAQRALRAAQ
jgi:hypothetical protein